MAFFSYLVAIRRNCFGRLMLRSTALRLRHISRTKGPRLFSLLFRGMVRRIPLRLKYARTFSLPYPLSAACRSPQPSGESSPRIIPWSGPAPDHPAPLCSCSVLTGPDIGAVHEADIPLHPAGGVSLPLHFGQDSLPQPLLPPAVKPAGYGAPRAVAFRQGAPVRSTHRMPLMMVRWSLPGRPVGGFCAGSNGAGRCHCSSLKSPRPTLHTSYTHSLSYALT